MFYTSDYNSYGNQNVKGNIFTVILNGFYTSNSFPTFSIAHASKPLINLSTIFGMQNVRFNKMDIKRVSIFNKFYCVLILSLLIIVIVYIPPLSWKETKSDLPLNILTRLFGVLQTFEIFYYVFIVSFGNASYYWNLYKTLNSLDNHYEKRLKMFRKRRYFAIFLMFTPLLLSSFTFYLRKFTIHNVVAQITFFIVMLQGVNFVYFIVNIFVEVLIFKAVLFKKVEDFVPTEINKKSFITNLLIKRLLGSENLKRHYCWFELMQIYDKIADCVYIFNKIYAGQILIMFEAWLLTTVLVICRSLSPSMKYSEVMWSDAFYYTFLNIRPFFLTKMSDFFIQDRRETLSLIIRVLIHTDVNDYIYQSQVQTMVNLVQSRKIELSAVVTAVDMPIMIAFAGKVISYSVLVIQYFYINN
ncbi:uncharacterized protein LOC123714218 isoform X1 [Pieris brassicae]|uniref:uncharacterized protein LOC123714218 isoform X1 n=1 Tax=Pieris brassicae TaxID=7116 RepID=UPI001E660B49|nr:uncharacterized protein LOC123714218 isoform X1 [Pieris brassicae]